MILVTLGILFALNSYGCCDKLTQQVGGILGPFASLLFSAALDGIQGEGSSIQKLLRVASAFGLCMLSQILFLVGIAISNKGAND